MRIIATTCLLALLTLPVYGQKIFPLTSNPVLERFDADRRSTQDIPMSEQALGVPKNECDQPDDPDVISVLAGMAAEIQFTIDTFGLGDDGTYECLNCDMLNFGTAELATDEEGNTIDSLLYLADAGIDADLETVQLRYCNNDNSECEEIEVTFLVRRAGTTTTPTIITVPPGEAINVDADLALPGTLRCNFFLDCVSEYEGRDQLAYFDTYEAPTNGIVYRAGRFAGRDNVCLVLCDDNGICDTTNYTFRVSVPSRNPPVYDDFSYAGPQPEGELWLDREVFVNTEIPINPPSVGAATFDGLTNRGRPYGDGFGPSDRLTSTYLDTESGDWTLSYWLQRGGLGDRPETKDSLVLQFRNEEEEWVSITKYIGLPGNTPFGTLDTFKFYTAPVTEEYQHERFQFRFVNYSDNSGFRDNWNLDYVRLDNNPGQSPNFNDIAFMYPPEFILENYSSMPWRHFQPQQDNELRSVIDVGVFNNFGSAQNASPSMASIFELNTGINPWSTEPTLFNGVESNIPSQEPVLRTYFLEDDPTGFSSVFPAYAARMASNDFDGPDELDFQVTYTLDNTSQDGQDFVQRNDEVSRITHFGDYFAYDDGTAENAFQISVNREVTVAFEASVPDTIYGVQVHFANVNEDFGDQQFRLRIFTEGLDGSPEYSQIYEPFYASLAFDTLQGFTSYRLLDADGNPAPFAVPVGTFYMGWQQASDCDFAECISVGYDLNRPQGKDFIFVNNGTGWNSLSEDFPGGSLMLRPFLGSEIGPTSVETIVEGTRVALEVYPNPVRDLVYLRTNLDRPERSEIVFFDGTGRQVLRQPFAEAVNISNLPAGMYIVQLQDEDGTQSMPRRLIITK